jgi:hypothetical protein
MLSHTHSTYFTYLLIYWQYWGLNSGLCACALLLEPCFQPILLWLFWRLGPGFVLFCFVFLARPDWTTIFLISAFQVARIAGVIHQCPAPAPTLEPGHNLLKCRFLTLSQTTCPAGALEISILDAFFSHSQNASVCTKLESLA